MNVFYGLLGVVAGILIIKYTYQITRATGSFGWAEEHLGGGTNTLFKIIGVVLIVVSFMWMTGTAQSLFISTFGPLFGIR